MKKGNWLRLGLVAAIVTNLFTAVIPNASADELKTTLDISKGSITIGDGTVTGKTSSGANAVYNANGYIITGSSTTYVVAIKGGVEQHVTLENASITKTTSAYGSIPTISIEGSGTKVYLALSGTNVVSSYNGATQKAPISVPEGTELIIDSIDGNDSHSLTASSYSSAAAIGGNISETAGSITINSGTITANFRASGSSAAAIGGGKGGAGGNIVINGGVITAESYNGTAAAIGGGDVSSTYPGKTTRVTINGGTINAKVPSNTSSYAYDVIGTGYASTTNRADNVQKTTVIINGGNLFTNNIQLLNGRQALNKDGQTVYATAIKVDTATAPAIGTAVAVHYGDQTLNTSILSSGTVYLFLPAGTIPVDITLKTTGKTYYGNVITTTSTTSYPNSAATVSRELNSSPTISVQADAEGDARFYYGTPVTLAVNNLGSVVNKGGYPLVYGTDYTVEWFKGAGANPTAVVNQSENPSQLTITAASGEVYRAKFVALTSEASKLDAGNAGSLSTSLTADWLKRTVSFTNVKETYSFGEEATLAVELSAGNDSVVFSSSDDSIISIDPVTGALKAHKLGTATVTATVAQNATAKQSSAIASHLIEVIALHPLTPVHVSAVPGNGEAVISFEKPDAPDGSINTAYTVSAWTGGEVVKTATGTSSPITVIGLENGTAYTFTVVATNATGDSPASSPSEEVTPATVPGKVTGIEATALDGQAEVRFTEPASNGRPISGYTVTAWTGGAAAKTATGTSSPITVTGLENGTTYTFTVIATNAIGDSLASDATEAVTPATVPSKVTGVTATGGNGQSEIRFTEPASNGRPISDYTVTAWTGGTAVKSVPGTTSPITVTGLENGTAYTFTVIATNTIGDSLASDATEAVTPATVPSKVTGVAATAGDGQSEVRFTEPASNGRTISGYTVTAWTGGAAVKTATGTSSPITITGLENGTAYTFTVVATNAIGDSLTSASSEEVTPTATETPENPDPGEETPAAVPDKPLNVQATAGNGEVSVQFTAPSSNGSNISLYTITAWTGGAAVKTATGTSSPITVTGLENGTAYTFTVVATNAIGDSPTSASSEEVTPTATETPGNPEPGEETPATVPDKPLNVQATAGNGEVRVQFTAPSSNGSQISLYTVTAWNGATAAKTATGISSPISVAGLVNGTTYTFTVVASNGIGDSLSSDSSSAVVPIGGGSTSPSVPVSTPVTPTTKVETVIRANEAGEVKLNEEVWVVVPKETSDQAIQIKVEKLLNSANLVENGQKLASPIFELLKNFTENFSKPITLRFAFDQKILQDESQTVSVFYYDETAKRWVEIGGVVSNGIISVQVDHFTKFAVFAVNKSDPKPVVQFTDIAGHWAETAIKQAVEQALISGYPEGDFKPNKTITRAEFIVILAKALNWQNEGQGLSFDDKDAIGSWAQKAIAQAVEAKVISGYNDGSFRPNAEITRAEIAVIVSRAFELARTDAKLDSSFADADAIPVWSRDAIEAARERGIITGRNGNLFAPNDKATRAEAVVIVLKALGIQ
ncbi:fibronectin type III domain-containing protein [Paenibacillus sinopodophylli]|uniref:fibronectin type III domain-containing protein n=1 Tax=Paenibacillus sinopodophylli TaxID=1837342 RepID=UPI00110CF0E4|nr:fibronectin type III domain-containing protein [Paenibacillus sinopodophylli]